MCFRNALHQRRRLSKNGKVKPKQSKDDGFTYRFNGTWKPREDLMFYATWSKGFRPGGINRQPGLAPYNPDFLVNYELGWKTTLGRLAGMARSITSYGRNFSSASWAKTA